MANRPPALPPGFRFYPTGGEVIGLLLEKIRDPNYISAAIAEVDLNKNEPSELPGKAKMGEKEFYFYCQKGKKYPTGTRTDRATRHGYWKATGKDKEIFKGKTLIGMKKTLVFYTGRAPRGEKTNWVMHEFRLFGDVYNSLPIGAKDSWVVCKVYNKTLRASGVQESRECSPPTLPPLADLQYMLSPATTDQEFLVGAPASSSSIPPQNFSSMNMMGLENVPQGYSRGTTLLDTDVNIDQPLHYSQIPAASVDQNYPHFGSANMSVSQDVGLRTDRNHADLDGFAIDFLDDIWEYFRAD